MAARKPKKAGFSKASKFIIWGWIVMFIAIFIFAIGMGTDYLVRTYEGDREYSRGLWKFCRAENVNILPYRYEIRCYTLDVTGSKPWQSKVRNIQAMEAVALVIQLVLAIFLIPVYILIGRLNSKPMAGILMAMAFLAGALIVVGMALFWIDFIDQGIGSLGFSWPIVMAAAFFTFVSFALLLVEFIKYKP